jgi:hypothetical protein
LISTTFSACIGAMPPPPTMGYGDAYHGTGEAIYVKDSRNDWDIHEGQHPLSSEQALEATADPEYEARRQAAKKYNDELYAEGQAHRRRGTLMIRVGVAAAIVGLVLNSVLVSSLRSKSMTNATPDMPEERDYSPGAISAAGYALLAAGVITAGYGFAGGRRTPPYHVWHTPGPLNRPAYVRQLTEPYDEKLGFSANPEDPANTAAPGQRKVVPKKQMPQMRGGR